VVGAGPAGLAVASKLATAGWKIGLLESGGDGIDRRARSLADGEVTGLPYYPLRKVRARALGGSSRLWLSRRAAGSPADRMRARPLDEIDFETRPHVPGSGWPFGAGELRQWYDQASAFCGLPANFPDAEPAPGLPGIEQTRAYFADPRQFRRLARAIAGEANVSLFEGATVVGWEHADGAMEAARVADEHGRWFEVSARAFVLAGGGIENARVLLLSEFGAPGGRANPHGQIGRYFMEHLHIDSGFVQQTTASEEYRLLSEGRAEDGSKIAALWRLPDTAQREHGLVNSVIEFRKLSGNEATVGGRALADMRWGLENGVSPARMAPQIKAFLRRPGSIARTVAEKFGREVAPAVGLVVTSEQSPLERSSVTLGTRTDAFGQRVARLEWHVANSDLESLSRTQDLLDAALRRAELGSIRDKWGEAEPNPRIDGCFHAIGTTRMGATTKEGVVDSDCRVHGMENLWIAGSSVMPTGGAATVTFTLLALALRLSNHLDAELRR